MNENSFATSISTDATPDEVFAAINDVRGWWSRDIEGSTDTLDGEFTFHGKDVHRSQIRVTEVVPGECPHTNASTSAQAHGPSSSRTACTASSPPDTAIPC
jgi:hypothetical protein